MSVGDFHLGLTRQHRFGYLHAQVVWFHFYSSSFSLVSRTYSMWLNVNLLLPTSHLSHRSLPNLDISIQSKKPGFVTPSDIPTHLLQNSETTILERGFTIFRVQFPPFNSGEFRPILLSREHAGNTCGLYLDTACSYPHNTISDKHYTLNPQACTLWTSRVSYPLTVKNGELAISG